MSAKNKKSNYFIVLPDAKSYLGDFVNYTVTK